MGPLPFLLSAFAFTLGTRLAPADIMAGREWCRPDAIAVFEVDSWALWLRGWQVWDRVGQGRSGADGGRGGREKEEEEEEEEKEEKEEEDKTERFSNHHTTTHLPP
jgi:hypothetical protein